GAHEAIQEVLQAGHLLGIIGATQTKSFGDVRIDTVISISGEGRGAEYLLDSLRGTSNTSTEGCRKHLCWLRGDIIISWNYRRRDILVDDAEHIATSRFIPGSIHSGHAEVMSSLTLIELTGTIHVRDTRQGSLPRACLIVIRGSINAV